MKAFIIILAILALCAAQEEQIRYILSSQASGKTSDQLIEAFSKQQNEILGKVFTHYIEQQIRKWRRSNISQQIIREKIHDFIVGRNPGLYANLKSFVEQKLFAKLDMHLLVESLQKEIKVNPQNYYLTFEVYDLLID